MAEKPVNEKLWTMVISQAKSKYHPYPSPGASNWVHKRYIELGGKFEDSSSHSARKAAIKKLWERKIKEKREAAQKHKSEGK